jgi:hypothetical protein
MDIEYEITAEDLFAFQWRGAYRSPLLRRARLRIYVYLFLALLLLSLLPAIGADGFRFARIDFVFLLVVFPLVALAAWLLDRRQTRRAIRELVKEEKQDRGQLGRHRIGLSGQGVHESTAVGESRSSWAGVDRVEQDPSYIFIYTAPHAAHVIPKRAFDSSADADRFYEFARLSREEALQASRPR